MTKIKVPRAVEESARRADELLSQMNDQTDPNTNPTDVVEVKDNTTSEKIDLSPEVAPVAPVVETKPPEYYEHRLKTVQGMWDADKRRQADEIARLKSEYEDRLAALETKLKQAPTVPEAFDVRNYFDEEEIDQLGNDLPKIMLKMAAKISKEAAQKVVDDRLDTELAPVRKEVEKAKEATQNQRQANFWSTFAASVPNWQEINGDVNFHNWLSEVEPMIGMTRQEMLTNAETRLDANAVISIFKAFGNETQKAKAELNSRLSRKEIPDSISTQPSTNVDTAPIFTSSQIKKHYDDFSRGLYKNRPEDWKKLERRIDEAYAAGRVSPG